MQTSKACQCEQPQKRAYKHAKEEAYHHAAQDQHKQEKGTEDETAMMCQSDSQRLLVTVPQTTRRAKSYSNVLYEVCSFILFMELAERLCYYGINQGMKNFMQKRLGWSAVASNSLKSSFTSFCYIAPLNGAWIADEHWGRYCTILVFGAVYVFGVLMITFSAHPDLLVRDRGLANYIWFFGLFGVAVGTGVIKANVVTFGADQFDPGNAEHLRQRSSFFSWFYFCINFGACISYGYLSYLCVEGMGRLISAEAGYFAAFFLCAMSMVAAMVWFYAGKKRYTLLPPQRGSFTTLFSVILSNARVCWGGRAITGGFVVFLFSFLVNAIGAFLMDYFPAVGAFLSFLAGGSALLGIALWIAYGMNPDFMNVTKQSMGGPVEDYIVKDVKMVVRVLPFAAFMVLWHCAYDQIDANFQSITQQCDLRFTRNEDSPLVPGAAVGIFGTLSIVCIIPFLEYVVYPAYTWYASKPPSPYGKVSAGLFIACLAMLWTGYLETWRKSEGELMRSNCTSVEPTASEREECFLRDSGTNQPMNDISWFWAIPMYAMVGASESLINVTALEVFYSNVPEHLKSTCQAINLFMLAMGANVTSIFTLAFAHYIPDNLNEGHLEYMFYSISASGAVNLIFFQIVMWKMRFGMTSSPKVSEPEHEAVSSIETIDRL